MPFRSNDWFCLSLVFLLALGLRCGYLMECTDAGEGKTPWQVQGEGPRFPSQNGAKALTEQESLIRHLREEGWFAGRTPLSDQPEDTASLSPGYPWLVAMVGRGEWPEAAAVRWGQCFLGSMTALLYFLIARRMFRSLALGFLTGLLTAAHPYWIINTAEIADGVLSSFLLAVALFLGLRAGREGGAFTSLLFGVSLACLSMVRAPLLPFSVVALIWFLPRCRALPQGWLCALLAFLGFANGLAPWLVRNVQTFGEPLPVVSSTWLHLWMGNNPRATGGHLDEKALRESFEEAEILENLDGKTGPLARKGTWLAALLKEKNQARRYNLLARFTLNEIQKDPGEALNRRLLAGTVFLVGEPWMREQWLALPGEKGGEVSPGRQWIDAAVPGLLAGSMILMIFLSLWGWRWSLLWGGEVKLVLLAGLFVPLPYLLGHAGILVGPRLPLDGVWLTFAALGLAGLLKLGRGEKEQQEGTSGM